MTQRYRFKIDTPWGKKGKESYFFYEKLSMGKRESLMINHEEYPDFFEPIPEPKVEDPVEKVKTWLNTRCSCYANHPNLVEELLAAGLRPEDLK